MSRVYRRGEMLGVGTFTAVFEGWDVLLDRAVAIKELLPSLASNETFVRSFLGRSLQQLDISHEHVLATYPADHGHQPPMVVRELADQTLEASLVGGPLPVEEVEEILRQTLSGLQVMHRRALVHGGIKPQNLFRCGARFKIGDFGIAPPPGGQPPPARERRYTAPEVLRGEDRAAASDIYSLGLVVYELLLGPLQFDRLPVELARPAEMGPNGDRRPVAVDELWPALHASEVEIPALHQRLPGFPVALSLTLQQMTRKNAADRLSDAGLILASLGHGRPAVTVPGPPSPSLAAQTASGEWRTGALSSAEPSAVRTSRIVPAPLQLLAGALAAALLTGAGWWLARHGGPVPPPAVIESQPAPATATPETLAAACRSNAIESAASADALGEALRRLDGGDRTLALDLEPLPGREPVRLAVGTPVHFRVTSEQRGHLLVFVLSSDGTLICLYPNSRRRDLVLGGGAGGGLVLPLAEDESAGFSITLAEPLGREEVFAVRSPEAVSPPPSGTGVSPWFSEFPLTAVGGAGTASPAKIFAGWVAALRCKRPEDTSLAVRELDVVAGR